MLVEELTFEGAHFAHICAYYERKRLARIMDQQREAWARKNGDDR